MAKTICRICLRTDRMLKTTKQILTDLHEELCDYTIRALKPLYCTECEYLLRKMYNFKRKCLMAVKILKNWKKEKSSERQPLSLLYTLLPPSYLEHWSANNNKIYSFIAEDGPSSTMFEESSQVNTVIPKEILFVNYPQSDSEKNCTEIKLANEDIKSESEYNNDFPDDILDDLVSVKSEASSISFKDVHLDDDSLLNNIEEFKEVGILKSDDDEIDKHFADKGDDNKEENHIDSNMIKDIKTNPTISDDQSYSNVGKKRTLNDLANLSFSDDDLMDDVDDTAQGSAAKKNVVKKSDNKKRKLNDTLDEQSETKTKKRRTSFSKARLLAELEFRFALSNELKTADGKTIDCQKIMKLVDESLELKEMKQLWRVIYGKGLTFPPKALKLFESIQNKTYKNEYEMYESVFVIERYKTRKEVLEGFQKRATYESYVSAPYKCEKCYQGFKHEKKLEYHVRKHDERSGAFACGICSARWRSKHRMTGHMKSHTVVFKCKMCPLVTCYRTSMINHYDQHKGKKYECAVCKLTYGSQSAYNTHRGNCRKKQLGERYVCRECGEEFAAYHHRRSHAIEMHRGEVPSDMCYKCKHCEDSFPSLTSLRSHMLVSHGTKLRYEEPKRRNHYTCRVCDATGNSYGWLKLHFSTEHPAVDMDGLYADIKKHLCDICGKGFANHYAFRDHMNQHKGLRPYSCGACPARFSAQVRLAAHRARHAAPAQPCVHCGKKFHTLASLHNHMRKHIGNRCYKCTFCAKGFLYRNALNAHVRGVHLHVRRKKNQATRGVKKSVEAD